MHRTRVCFCDWHDFTWKCSLMLSALGKDLISASKMKTCSIFWASVQSAILLQMKQTKEQYEQWEGEQNKAHVVTRISVYCWCGDHWDKVYKRHGHTTLSKTFGTTQSHKPLTTSSLSPCWVVFSCGWTMAGVCSSSQCLQGSVVEQAAAVKMQAYNYLALGKVQFLPWLLTSPWPKMSWLWSCFVLHGRLPYLRPWQS